MSEYTFGRFALEFTPATGTKGYLTTTVKETTYGAQLNIANTSAREKYFKDARKLYPEEFGEDSELEFLLAITELSTHVVDQINVSEAKAAENADEEDPVDVVAENAPEEGSERYAIATALLKKEDIFEEAAKMMRALGQTSP